MIDPAMKSPWGSRVLILVLLIRPQGLFGGAARSTDELLWLVATSLSFLENVDFWIGVGVLAATYGIFALGIQLNVGTTGIFNFGQAGFMAVGAYTMGILVVKSGLSFWLAWWPALGVAIAAGLLVGLPSLRLRADYFAIATLAFSEIVRYVAQTGTGSPAGTGLLGFEDSGTTRRLGSLGWLEHSASRPAFLLPLLVVNVACFLLLDAFVALARAVALGARAPGDPRGRGRRARAGQERLPLQAAVAGARRRAAAVAGYMLAINMLDPLAERTSTRCSRPTGT